MLKFEDKALFLSVAVGALVFLPASGYVAELDFRDWVAERPLPDGWTHNSLKKGNGGAYFNTLDGWLLSPRFSAAIRSVTVEAWSSSPTPTRSLHLRLISGGVTNETDSSVAPTESPTDSPRNYGEQEFPSGDTDADQLVLRMEGSKNTGNWWLRRVVVRYGDASTDPGGDPLPRCWSLSDFMPKPGFRVADFAALQYAKPDTSNAWRNGITVEGFHAFSDDGACTNIRVGNSSSEYSGLYVIVTNDAAGPVWALSLLGSSGSGMHVLLPVALDAVRPPARLSVGYRVWTLENGKESTLSFSCQGLDDIGAMSATAGGWTEVGEGTWTSGDPDAVRTVDVPPCVLDGKKFVCLRWSVPKKKSSPIIGIADVRITAAVEPSGFLMSVR